MTASANVEVISGLMYWLTSRTRRSTSRSTWPASCVRRGASRAGFESCSSAPLETHLESIGSSLPPGSRRPSSTTLPPTQTLRCSISGGRCRSTSSRMFSPAAPRVELPATSLAWPSARRTRLQTSHATPPMDASTHTSRSANNSSSADIWGILVRKLGTYKVVNMDAMAEIKPISEAGQAPDRIPLEEVYMRMAEELAKRSTCARLQVGTVITTPDLTQVLGIGYNGNARGLPNRCDTTTPGACGCLHSEQNALIKAGAQLPGKFMFVSASPCVMCAKMAINANVARVYYREAYRDPAGLDTLRQGGVEVIQYNRWRDLWR